MSAASAWGWQSSRTRVQATCFPLRQHATCCTAVKGRRLSAPLPAGPFEPLSWWDTTRRVAALLPVRSVVLSVARRPCCDRGLSSHLAPLALGKVLPDGGTRCIVVLRAVASRCTGSVSDLQPLGHPAEPAPGSLAFDPTRRHLTAQSACEDRAPSPDHGAFKPSQSGCAAYHWTDAEAVPIGRCSPEIVAAAAADEAALVPGTSKSRAEACEGEAFSRGSETPCAPERSTASAKSEGLGSSTSRRSCLPRTRSLQRVPSTDASARAMSGAAGSTSSALSSIVSERSDNDDLPAPHRGALHARDAAPTSIKTAESAILAQGWFEAAEPEAWFCNSLAPPCVTRRGESQSPGGADADSDNDVGRPDGVPVKHGSVALRSMHDAADGVKAFGSANATDAAAVTLQLDGNHAEPCDASADVPLHLGPPCGALDSDAASATPESRPLRSAASTSSSSRSEDGGRFSERGTGARAESAAGCGRSGPLNGASMATRAAADYDGRQTPGQLIAGKKVNPLCQGPVAEAAEPTAQSAPSATAVRPCGGGCTGETPPPPVIIRTHVTLASLLAGDPCTPPAARCARAAVTIRAPSSQPLPAAQGARGACARGRLRRTLSSSPRVRPPATRRRCRKRCGV